MAGSAAVAFILGVVAAWLVAVVAAMLWWADHRRMLQQVVGFSVRALGKALDDLAGQLPPEGSLAAQVHGCRELCAALQHLVDG